MTRLALLSCVTAVTTAGTCVPDLMPIKKYGAVNPSAPIGGYATVSQCPSFPQYQQTVDPVVERLCLTCHGPGGSGSNFMQLTPGGTTDNNAVGSNFFAIRNQAVPTNGTIVVNPSDLEGTSPVLERLDGAVSHPLALDQASEDYVTIRAWVVKEVQQTCVIDPTTGTVTVGGG